MYRLLFEKWICLNLKFYYYSVAYQSFISYYFKFQAFVRWQYCFVGRTYGDSKNEDRRPRLGQLDNVDKDSGFCHDLAVFWAALCYPYGICLTTNYQRRSHRLNGIILNAVQTVWTALIICRETLKLSALGCFDTQPNGKHMRFC